MLPPDSRRDLEAIIHQIVLSSTDTEYFDRLTPAIQNASNDGRGHQLLQSLVHFSDDREAEIERMCSSNHQEFTSSVNQLLRVREGVSRLTSEILGLNHAIQSSTENLAAQKKGLVECRGIRQGLSETRRALGDCLDVLRLANQVHDLLGKKSHYAALQALEELQNVHLRNIAHLKIALLIQRSVPVTKKMVADAVMADLNTWLFRIRETSQFLGEVAFYSIEQRRSRHKGRCDQTTYLSNFKFNSPVELALDEHFDFNVLDNDDVQVDFTPLFECLHIHIALGQLEKFRAEYAATRRQQKELLMPQTITLLDADGASLSGLLEEITGFAVVERVSMEKAPGLRSTSDVEDLWDSMCQNAINLISNALKDVNNAEQLLKIKGMVALFILTTKYWGYSVRSLESFILVLFEKYADLLKSRFSEDFQEIVMTDDYMPMPINNSDEYDKVISVSWYSPDKPKEELRFPCVLPFSQMYPLCCIDIRNFLNQFYCFWDDSFQQPKIIDDALQACLDELLSDKVCQSLVDRLRSQYLGQIVQILINLEHFEIACRELEQILLNARSVNSAGGSVILGATESFKSHKKTAEKRIFEVVNSKIDDLVEIAQYDWTARAIQKEPSNYVQTLTQYLSNIMTTVLLGLPAEIKELLYFNALSYAATKILSLPLAPDVKKINPYGVAALAKDVQFLSDFVGTLQNPILQENLDELRQTVNLMQADNTDEYYDMSTRNKKYGKVNALNGPLLLEKLTYSVQSPTKVDKGPTFSSKFGYH